MHKNPCHITSCKIKLLKNAIEDSPNHFDNWYCSVNPTAAPATTSTIATTSTTAASATASTTAPNDSSTKAPTTPSPETVKECGVPNDSITFSSKHQPISILSDDGSGKPYLLQNFSRSPDTNNSIKTFSIIAISNDSTRRQGSTYCEWGLGW